MAPSKDVYKSLFIPIKTPCLYPLNLPESPSLKAGTQNEEADKGWAKWEREEERENKGRKKGGDEERADQQLQAKLSQTAKNHTVTIWTCDPE